MSARGLDKISIRVPEQWSADWYKAHLRDVLALADVRNAIPGGGIAITGNTDEPATISASADVAALTALPYVLMSLSGSVPNERKLTSSSQITVVDGGAGGNVTLTLADGSVDSGQLAQQPAWSVLGRSASDTGFPAAISATSDGQVLRLDSSVLGFGALNLASANAITGDLPFANLTQGSALSVLGVAGNATADVASIAAGSDGQVMRRSGTAIAFGAVDLASANAITGDLPYSNLTQGSALSVLGVAGNATADNASIVAGSDGHVLRRSGTSVGFGTVATAGYADDSVTYAKIQNVTATSRLLGRKTAGAGDVEELTSSDALTILGLSATPTLDHGTYTPTLTAVSGAVSSLSADAFQYMRVGNTVTVSGSFTWSCTGSATKLNIGVSLPIASSLSNSGQLAGGGSTSRSDEATLDDVARVIADVTNDRANVKTNASTSGTNTYRTEINFTYLVI